MNISVQKKMLFAALFGAFAVSSVFLTGGRVLTTSVAHADTTDDCAVAVALSNTVSNPIPHAGETIVYTLSGTSALTASTTVSITDMLGAGLTYVSANPSMGTYSNSTGVWDVGTLNNGTALSLTLTATVNADASGTINNAPTLVKTNCGVQSEAIINASITITPVVLPQADIAIKKTADVATTTEGSTVHYTLAVTGNGPTTSMNVVATDAFPAGLTFISDTASVGSYASSTGIWTIGDLSASSTATLTIAATVNTGTASSTITNTATVTESASTTDQVYGNNHSAVSIYVQPNATTTPTSTTPLANLSVTKTVDIATPAAGDTVHYTVTVKDNGPATSTDAVVTDLLPAGITFVSDTASVGSYVSSTGIWTIGDLSANASATLTIVATVNASTTGTVVNTATAMESASSTDPDLTNNIASATISIPPIVCGGGCTPPSYADISITKTVDNANPGTGATVNYTLTVAALGSVTSTGVVATDTLPSGVTFVSATSSVGFYASSTGTWTIGDMSASSTATLVITATVNAQAGTTIDNTGLVGESASSTDNDTSNNSSTVTLTVAGGSNPGCISNCGGGGGSVYSNVSIVKTVDNASPSTSSTIHYTLKVSDAGQSATYGVVVNDLLPAGVTFVSANPSEGSYVSSTGVWTIGSLSLGETATLVITATVNAPAGTTVTNTGTVSESSNIVDPVPSDNTSSVSFTVPNGGGGGGGGQVLGASTSTGQVLGESCGLYLTSYIHPYRQDLNDPAQVKKLQTFLNTNLGLSLPVTGYYGSQTIAAVNQFQTKYHIEVLAPWVPLGLQTQFTPTSYVYQTTQRWINLIMCPSLNLPAPALQVDNSEKSQ